MHANGTVQSRSVFFVVLGGSAQVKGRIKAIWSLQYCFGKRGSPSYLLFERQTIAGFSFFNVISPNERGG